ncbi:MAG TPA: LysM peptidoglycan-binding domain-containing protein [bacterium]|nr:LysM peptidoglycan-binding domain-containing protein [bacterium]
MKIIRLKIIFALLSAVGVLGACATAPKNVETAIPQDHFAEIQRPDIPLVMNDRVQDWLDYFQGTGRSHFERYLARSAKYIPMIRKVLKQHGLPQDLVYLAMIESGFNPHAYSRARATGTWQFIYQTGVRYGLQVDQWVDERRDPEKSTVAAAKYLKDLYDRYNDWYLAAASYNAGEGKIDRAIRKYATEDFWELSHGRYLRNETKDYVPKLIAAAMIARDPEKYGFKNIPYESPVAFESVEIEEPVDLRVAAKCAGITYEEMKALNPEILHWVTPPQGRNYQIKVPAGTGGKFLSSYASLKPYERLGDEKVTVDEIKSIRRLADEHDVPPVLLAAANGRGIDDTLSAGTQITLPMAPPEGESFYEKVYERRRGGRMIAYRVRRGDTAKSISRNLGISVAALKDYNPHVNWSKVRVGQKLKIQTAPGKTRYAKAGKGTKYAKKSRGGRNVAMVEKSSGKGGHATHKVQSGDTLGEIAKKYNVTTGQLKAANGISDPKKLKQGQTLKIPAPSKSASNISSASPSM